MAGYQLSPSGGSALGTLLRKMQEDRLNQPASVPVSAGDQSPIRAQVQGPLQAPESMGSDKLVSIKAPMQPGSEQGGMVTPSSTAPIATRPAPGAVVAPVAEQVNLPGITSPPSNSNYSPAGVQVPSSTNNQPASSGQVQGATTTAKNTSPVKPSSSPQPAYTPSPFVNNKPASQPSSNNNNSGFGGLASQLLPSAMKAAQTVGKSLTNLRGMISGSPLFILPNKLDQMFGPGSTSKAKKS